MSLGFLILGLLSQSGYAGDPNPAASVLTKNKYVLILGGGTPFVPSMESTPRQILSACNDRGLLKENIYLLYQGPDGKRLSGVQGLAVNSTLSREQLFNAISELVTRVSKTQSPKELTLFIDTHGSSDSQKLFDELLPNYLVSEYVSRFQNLNTQVRLVVASCHSGSLVRELIWMPHACVFASQIPGAATWDNSPGNGVNYLESYLNFLSKGLSFDEAQHQALSAIARVKKENYFDNLGYDSLEDLIYRYWFFQDSLESGAQYKEEDFLAGYLPQHYRSKDSPSCVKKDETSARFQNLDDLNLFLVKSDQTRIKVPRGPSAMLPEMILGFEQLATQKEALAPFSESAKIEMEGYLKKRVELIRKLPEYSKSEVLKKLTDSDSEMKKSGFQNTPQFEHFRNLFHLHKACGDGKL